MRAQFRYLHNTRELAGLWRCRADVTEIRAQEKEGFAREILTARAADDRKRAREWEAHRQTLVLDLERELLEDASHGRLLLPGRPS